MSQTSVPKTLQELLQEREKLDAAIHSMGGKVSVEKKKKVGVKGAWSEWTAKVCAENKEEIKTFVAAQEKKVGAHLKWLSEHFGKTSPEWLAFQASWNAEHPKGAKEVKEESSDAASSSGASSGASKRRGPKKLDEMTAEEKAKHVADVAARKAKRDAMTPEEKAAKKAAAAAKKAVAEAKKAGAPAPVAAPVAVAPVVAPVVVAVAPVVAPKPVAAPVAEDDDEESMETADEEEPVYEPLPFKLGPQTYFRLGLKSEEGEPEWAEGGDLWYAKKAAKGVLSKGSYAGVLQEDGSIDTDAEEPTLNE